MNGLNVWTDPLAMAYGDIVRGVSQVLPGLVAAIIIFIIGWVIAGLLSQAIAQVIKSIKLDKALGSAGVGEMLSKADIKLDSGKFLGEVVRWFVVAIFLVAVLNSLGLSDVNAFLTNVVSGYIPQVIAAIFILIISALVADFLRKAVVAGAKGLDLKNANFLGSVTKYAVWVVAILASLAQLGIAPYFIQVLYTGIVTALTLALGLAFGLGGQDAAAKLIDSVKEEVKSK